MTGSDAFWLILFFFCLGGVLLLAIWLVMQFWWLILGFVGLVILWEAIVLNGEEPW
jgi:hypothetical protein